MVAVLALFMCFGALNVLGIPPLLPIDERAHVGYALALADGELPTIDTPLPSSFPPADRDYRNTVWVANHPPLYYLLAAPFARVGLAVGGVDSAVELVRWLSLLLGAGALVLVYATALLITRDDRDVALLSTALAALLPHTLHVSSLAHNDSLATLMAAATLYAALRVAIRGYSRAGVIALAVTAALAMATRFTSVAVVVPACGLACVALLLDATVPMQQRIRRSLAAGALALGTTLITSGWFYLRNLRLYDDVTGGAALFEKVGRTPRGNAFGLALQRRLWRQIYEHLWTRFSGGVRLDGVITEVAWTILFVALLGIGLRAYARYRRGPIPWTSPTAVGVAGLAATVVLILAAMFEFYSRGGSLHARYLLPIAWVPALALAWGLTGLGKTAARTVVVLVCLLDFLAFSTYLGGLVTEPTADAVPLVQALEHNGIRGASWFVAVIVIVVALALRSVFDDFGSSPEGSRTTREA